MQITSVQIIVRAIAAGIAGGLLAALFVAVVAEDSIDEAIVIEETRDNDEAGGAGARNEEPLVGRDLQVAGGLLASVLYGVFTGTAFGTVFASVRHRIRAVDDFRRSVLLAAAAFVATAFIPAIKYPANPPAIGDPATVGRRTILYFTLLGVSIVVMFAIGLLYSQLRSRVDQPTSTVVAAAAGLLAFAAVLVLWPDSPDSVPTDFPPDLLWRFRLESIATLAIAWSTLGLGLGWLLTRAGSDPPASDLV